MEVRNRLFVNYKLSIVYFSGMFCGCATLLNLCKIFNRNRYKLTHKVSSPCTHNHTFHTGRFFCHGHQNKTNDKHTTKRQTSQPAVTRAHDGGRSFSDFLGSVNFQFCKILKKPVSIVAFIWCSLFQILPPPTGHWKRCVPSATMVVTKDVFLPTEEELTVPEVNLSGPALRAGAYHLGKQCEAENNVRSWGAGRGRALPADSGSKPGFLEAKICYIIVLTWRWTITNELRGVELFVSNEFK